MNGLVAVALLGLFAAMFVAVALLFARMVFPEEERWAEARSEPPHPSDAPPTDARHPRLPL